MQEYVCNYSLIRFLPYRDAGEFVNIGVMLACGKLRYLDFRIEPRRYKRVTNFFPELDAPVYRDGLRGLRAECERWRKEMPRLANYPIGESEMLMRHIFSELTRAQESVFHFSMPRTLLTAQPDKTLDELFARYVQRRTLEEEVHGEEAMRLQIAQDLRRFGVLSLFRPEYIGTPDYNVKFPFASQSIGDIENDEKRVIKPLNLDRSEPSEITQHGDDWYMRVMRLHEIGHLPKRLLFPVQMPQNDARRTAAADQVRLSLEGFGAETALVTDIEHLREFTRNLPLADTQLPLDG